MKLSLNTIKKINARYKMADDLTGIGVDKLVEKIGAQLGAVEEVVEVGDKYKGIIIAKVLECEKHPDADKLSLCIIDDNGAVKDVKRDSNGHVQVVCGAPNVRAGMYAAWIPPGATVPSTVGKEPFVIEAREIRGKVSNGMLASPAELDMGDNHSGILEVESKIQPGTSFEEAFGLKDDVIIDIENKMFTHRPDCFGWLGITRELAGIQGLPFKSPDWYKLDPEFPSIEAEELKLEVKNELPKLVPRFSVIAMSNIEVKPSPAWLQVELAKVGQKPINNIVDYTNFLMLLTGQPLHAYDYDKVKERSGGDGATIVVRHPKKGEKVKLLNGKKIEPREEAIMIATDQELIGVGGVMGGSDTEVDADTKNIIIEVANFDMYSVRRTSMAHGLFTEASTRFNKGQSPLQTLPVLELMVEEIQKLGGKVASDLTDINHVPQTAVDTASLNEAIILRAAFINQRLGLDLQPEEIVELLENVEFHAHTADEDNICVTAPFWRTDIEIPEDIVEEVGRLYGYDHLPLELPARDLTPAKRNEGFDLKAEIRRRLSVAGANEVLTYSFVSGDLLQKASQDVDQAFQVANALSPDLQYYRLSLAPSLLEKVHPNIKAGHDEFALFEIGKVHNLNHKDDDGLPGEFEFTALVVTANDKLKKPGAPYYLARKYLEALVGVELEFKPVGDDMKPFPVTQPYDQIRSALVSAKGGKFLGIIGEFKPSVIRSLKLPGYSAGFELDTTELGPLLSAGSNYTPLSRFPKVSQDITLKVASDLSFADLSDFVDKQLGDSAPVDTLSHLEPIDVFQKVDDSHHKQVTFRITITGQNRTLTDKEVATFLDDIAKAAHSKLKAERI